jgi:lysozyme
MPDLNHTRFVAMISRHEGRRTHPYKDQMGKITIGVGRNLSDRGLAPDEIDLLLANDIELARHICRNQFGPSFTTASLVRQMALMSMAFNLGGPRLAGFKRMQVAIIAGKWREAAAQAQQSRWAAQVGTRAVDIARMLATGTA